MTFIPQTTTVRSAPIEGSGPGKILIIGDHPDMRAYKANRPFHGGLETTLQTCLHMAGLIRHDVITTNLLFDVLQLKKFWNDKSPKKGKNQLVGNVKPYLAAVLDIVIETKPSVIVTMGELPSFLFTDKAKLSATRGYVFHSDLVPQPVIPTFHVGKTLFANYIWRYYIAHDLGKAKDLKEKPGFELRPQVIVPENYSEAKRLLRMLSGYSHLSVDIEVANFEISCIGFAFKNQIVSIPFDMRWSLEEEVTLWRLVAKILEDPAIAKTGQNFIFDMHFLAMKMGIVVRGAIWDTMIAHSILYPEFKKSLEFLASIYSKQPYWKDMVSFKNIKKEA